MTAPVLGAPSLLARIGADHLGHAKVSMTPDRYMTRGRMHAKVTELLDNALVTADSAVITDELTMTDEDQGSENAL